MSKSTASMAKAFNDIRADWNMSRESRFVRRRTGLPSSYGASADWHYRNENDYYNDIEKARDMDRNDAVVGQTVDRAVANIVQDGFSLDPKTGLKAVDAVLKARWQEWANDTDKCDITGEYTFHDLEMHACRAMLVDGDCVNLALDSGHLQHVEAHLVRRHSSDPMTFLGVTRNRQGRHESYWVVDEEIDPHKQNSRREEREFKTRNAAGNRVVFHVYKPKRASQTRGITAFAPIFELSGMFEDIQFAKLVQQQVVSCFAIFRKRGFASEIPGNGAEGYGSPSTESTSAGTRYIEDIAPGMEIVGEPGEELQGFSPNTPNAEYFTHVKLMLQMIGVNLGLPLCLVLMDGSETNFSGWRGAVDEARKGFKSNQRNLMNRFHEPVYRWKVAQWLAEDSALRRQASKSTVNIFAHKWNAPAWEYIDPVGDAQGDILQLQNALTSPRRLQARRGADWEEVQQEIIEDNALAIEAAKKRAARINNKHPNEPAVHWRELINLPMPNGVQMTMQDPNAVEAQTMAARQDQEQNNGQ